MSRGGILISATSCTVLDAHLLIVFCCRRKLSKKACSCRKSSSLPFKPFHTHPSIFTMMITTLATLAILSSPFMVEAEGMGGADMAAMKQKAGTFTNKATGTVTASAGVDSTSENASVEAAAAAAASAACGQAAEADAKVEALAKAVVKASVNLAADLTTTGSASSHGSASGSSSGKCVPPAAGSCML